MGTWCNTFPLEEWSEEWFTKFVDQFKEVREQLFGGNLDGIDFDFEGFCPKICLDGNCKCEWDDHYCGNKSPEELKEGVRFNKTYSSPGNPTFQYMCYTLPTKGSMQVMTGITHHMKEAGFVVTLVPRSSSAYSGEPDPTRKQDMRNEFVKWRKHTIQGETRDLLQMVDSVLLQWQSGSDLSLCRNSHDPSSCYCDNDWLVDYPNIHNNNQKDPHNTGLLYHYFEEDGFNGNMYPQFWPVRCQTCGFNITAPNGSTFFYPCFIPGDDWFMPGNVT